MYGQKRSAMVLNSPILSIVVLTNKLFNINYLPWCHASWRRAELSQGKGSAVRFTYQRLFGWADSGCRKEKGQLPGWQAALLKRLWTKRQVGLLSQVDWIARLRKGRTERRFHPAAAAPGNRLSLPESEIDYFGGFRFGSFQVSPAEISLNLELSKSDLRSYFKAGDTSLLGFTAYGTGTYLK